MRVSEINKEIEKMEKVSKKVRIFLVVEFVVIELCCLGIGYKFKDYYCLGLATLMELVIIGVCIPMAYKADQKELKTLIEKRIKLEQDEQFIKRRVGIYEAADDEQKKQLSGAYFDVNEAYKANFIGGMDLVCSTLTKMQMKKRVNSTAYGIAGTAAGGTALGYVAHLEAERRNDEIDRHNSELRKKSFQQEMEGERKQKEAKKQIEESEARLKELESEIERTKDVELKNWSYENYKDYDWSKVGRQSRMVTIEGVEYNVDRKGIGLSPVVDEK